MVAAGNIIRATELNDLVQVPFAFSTANTVWTAAVDSTTRKDVAGLTFPVTTVNPNALVVVTFTVDLSVSTAAAGNSWQFRLEVDGVSGQGFGSCPSGLVGRYTIAHTERITHASPGTYTYTVTGLCGALASGATSFGGISTMTAVVKDLAA